jgi:hypothetical protein
MNTPIRSFAPGDAVYFEVKHERDSSIERRYGTVKATSPDGHIVTVKASDESVAWPMHVAFVYRDTR